MEKGRPRRFESAGWLFWLVVTLVVSPFIMWFIHANASGEMHKISFVPLGLLLGSLVSAFITWGVNTALQARAERIRRAEKLRASQHGPRQGKRTKKRAKGAKNA